MATAAEYTYQRGDAFDLVELATVTGREVGLPPHFHDEDQVTFVLSGRRQFWLDDELVGLEPGRCALIPAGTVHRSMPELGGVACLNLYLPAGDYERAAMIEEAERLPYTPEGIDASALMTIVRRHRTHLANPAQSELRRRLVGAQAACAAMSREGFTRAYARDHGMPPHAHGVAARLNQARRRLRAGGDLAAVALEAGFADQSHLGRWFRRLFGVTPGRYRAGWSQTFQTQG